MSLHEHRYSFTRLLFALLCLFVSTPAFAQSLYWFNFDDETIRRANLDGSVPGEVFATTQGVGGLALDGTNDKLYWSDSDGIHRANLDATNFEIVVSNVEANATQTITVDPVAAKLYWSSTQGEIKRANLDGSNVELVFAVGNSLLDIAVDSVNAKVYWTNSEPGRVERVGLDGTNREMIHDAGVGGIIKFIEIDVASGKIYWNNAIGNPFSFGLYRANKDGSQVEHMLKLIDGVGVQGLALDLSGQKIYFGDSILSNVFKRANLDGSGLEALLNTIGPLSGVEFIAFGPQSFSPAAPELDVTPTALDFGTVDVGATGLQKIDLTNTGGVALNITDLQIAGAHAADFSVAGATRGVIQILGGQTLSLFLRFSPSALGLRTADLIITHDGPSSPTTVMLSGTGQTPVPRAIVSPTDAPFGLVEIGAVSFPDIITVTNVGIVDLTVNSVSIAGSHPGDFQHNAAVPATLTPGESLSFTTLFEPTTTGLRNAQLTIAHNGPESPEIVTLSGTGQTPVPHAGVTPSIIAYGSVEIGDTSSPRTVTVTNVGVVDLSVGAVSVSGSHPGDFLHNAAGPTVLTPGDSLSFTVTFSPQASGDRSAILEIATDDPGGTSFLTLRGTGFTITPGDPLDISISLGGNQALLEPAYYDGTAANGEPLSAGGRAAFFPTINPTADTIAFWSVPFNAMSQAGSSSLFAVDLGDPTSWRRITTDVGFGPDPITWTPDGTALFSDTNRIDLATGSVESTANNFIALVRHVSVTPVGNGHLGIGSLFDNTVISSARLGASGTLSGADPSVPQGNIFQGLVGPQRIGGLAVSRGATALAFTVVTSESMACGVEPDSTDLYIIRDIPGILTSGTPINSLGDPRVIPIRVNQPSASPYVDIAGDTFSEDGSLIFYGQDFGGTFSQCDPIATFQTADFDILVSDVTGTDLLNTPDGDLRLQEPGNQRITDTSGGGLRVLLETSGTNSFGHSEIFSATLVFAASVSGTDVSNTTTMVDTDGDGSTDTLVTLGDNALQIDSGLPEPITIEDAAGTQITLEPGTIIDFPAGSPQELTIETPVEPVGSSFLPPEGEVAALPIVRDFGPDGAILYPPAVITIHYTEDELQGNEESGVAVFLFNESTNQFERLPDEDIIAVDTVQNTVTFRVSHFSVFAVGFGAPALPLGHTWPYLALIVLVLAMIYSRVAPLERVQEVSDQR